MTFAAAVAERSGKSLIDVESVLTEYRIVPQPNAAVPVALHVTKLRFSGTKRREGHPDEDFEFDRDFEPGVWAITSEKMNLAGKSSVLFIIRWALTGRSHLTDDVFDWISDVALDGEVGGEPFTVQFARTPDGLAGELRANGALIATFDENSFEEVTDGFFLERLRLDPMPFWQSRAAGDDDEGDRRRFGWNSYFPALHLKADNTSALLGDQVLGGQPGALMQVFLGLPWALTAATARVANNQLTMQRSALRRRREEDEAARGEALEPLRAELEAARQQLATLQAERPALTTQDADTRLAAFAQALTAQRDVGRRLAASRLAVQVTQDELDSAVKRAQAIEQTRLVRPLLGRLTPTACPRCNTGIGDDRLHREVDEHECSVCAEPLAEDEVDESEVQSARDDVQAATDEHQGAVAELEAAERDVAEAAEVQAAAEAAVKELEERRPAEQETRELERQIARLEGRLEQHQEVGAPDDNDDLDLASQVVGAAKLEADERRAEAASGLLNELGEEIGGLARRFGISNLERAEPNLGAQLRLHIGGSPSTFSSRTGGERLRLRLATVIALLRVGQRRGVGRHPGLLLVDSPGGEEMVQEDVISILQELVAVSDELPGLQLICATAHAAEVRDVLQDERIIRGPEYAEVW